MCSYTHTVTGPVCYCPRTFVSLLKRLLQLAFQMTTCSCICLPKWQEVFSNVVYPNWHGITILALVVLHFSAKVGTVKHCARPCLNLQSLLHLPLVQVLVINRWIVYNFLSNTQVLSMKCDLYVQCVIFLYCLYLVNIICVLHNVYCMKQICASQYSLYKIFLKIMLRWNCDFYEIFSYF